MGLELLSHAFPGEVSVFEAALAPAQNAPSATSGATNNIDARRRAFVLLLVAESKRTA